LAARLSLLVVIPNWAFWKPNSWTGQGLLAIRLPEQLRQPRNVDGDPSRLFARRSVRRPFQLENKRPTCIARLFQPWMVPHKD
jgi:hypothetical protein